MKSSSSRPVGSHKPRCALSDPPHPVSWGGATAEPSQGPVPWSRTCLLAFGKVAGLGAEVMMTTAQKLLREKNKVFTPRTSWDPSVWVMAWFLCLSLAVGSGFPQSGLVCCNSIRFHHFLRAYYVPATVLGTGGPLRREIRMLPLRNPSRPEGQRCAQLSLLQRLELPQMCEQVSGRHRR